MITSEKSPPILRQISVKSVINRLIRGRSSRAQLAKETGLSKQTMSQVISTLEAEEWVRKVGSTSGHIGRSAVLYEINPKAGFVLAIDISPDRVQWAVSDILGRVQTNRIFNLGRSSGKDLIGNILSETELLLDELAEDVPLRFICLAAPGVIDPETGTTIMAPNMPGLMGTNLAKALRDRFSCETIVENDVNTAIVGERWQGAAAQCNSACYVVLGSGVGVGSLVDGHLLRGATGAAGEVCYLPFGTDSNDEDSKERGALERALSIGSVLSDFSDPAGDGATVAAFLTALDHSDPKALAALAQIGELGSMLVLSVHAVLDPEVVVIGGELGLSPVVFDAIKQAYLKKTKRPTRVVGGVLGLQATIKGATFLALSGMYEHVFAPQWDATDITALNPVSGTITPRKH